MIDTFQVTCTENSHLGTYTRTNAEYQSKKKIQNQNASESYSC